MALLFFGIWEEEVIVSRFMYVAFGIQKFVFAFQQ